MYRMRAYRMKFIIDKIDDGARHSVSKQDIMAILAAVPSEWTEGVVRVRLANGGRTPLRVWLAGGEMTILSRGRARELIVDEILIQLAKNALGLQRGLGHLTKDDRKKLTKMIEPVRPVVWSQLDNPVGKMIEIKLNDFNNSH
jgi:hypothetical protein